MGIECGTNHFYGIFDANLNGKRMICRTSWMGYQMFRPIQNGGFMLIPCGESQEYHLTCGKLTFGMQTWCSYECPAGNRWVSSVITRLHAHAHALHTYITIHYITLHYIYITLHYITSHDITLHYSTLQHITAHYIHYLHTYMTYITHMTYMTYITCS